ncbi:cell wall-binding repeat-containing protein [Desulfosporosinus acididurans]|nr:cell wall-binding repeat-containing protein [Desulfosporosinus acididurans]
MIMVPKGAYAVTATKIQNTRLAGEDQYQTAAAIANAGWTSSYYAVVASGENFPDALCAAPLAAKYDAPILLNSVNHLEDATKEELLNLHVKSVIMIGGQGILSAGVQQEIENLGINVWRIAGQDRYATSLDVAQVLGKSDDAVIASGDDFQDVLSVAPIAALKQMPIILTPENLLQPDIKDYVEKSVEKTYVLGDESYISDGVVKQLPSPQRINSTDHYSTNIEIIKTFAKDLDLSTCYVATGETYPDALSGSVLASLTKSPVILVKEPLNAETLSFFTDNMNNIKKVTALGGTAVVSDNLLSTITTNTSAASGTATDSGTKGSTTSGVNGGTDSGSNTGNNSGTNTGVDNNGILGSPNHFEADAVDTNEIDLSWDSVNNAISYNVYRTTADSGIYQLVTSATFPYYTDDTVSSGVTYYYKVQAVNTTGTGAFSNVVYATALLDQSVFSPPTNLVAVGQNNSQILLSWSGVSNAAYYNIYRATSFSGTYEKIASPAFVTYLDSSVSTGKVYYYKVQAVGAKGPSDFSNITYTATK